MNKHTRKQILRDMNSNNVLATTMLTVPNYDGLPTSGGIIGSLGFDTTNNNFIGHDNTGWNVLGGTAAVATSINFMASNSVQQNILGGGAIILFSNDFSFPNFNNTAGAYNPSTSIFTAPQNGKYQINAFVKILTQAPATATSLVVYLNLNNIFNINEQETQYNGAEIITYSSSIILNLTTGNTLNTSLFCTDPVQVQTGGGTILSSTFSASLIN